MTPLDSILTPADVAAQIGCTADTVSRVARERKIGRLIGGRWFFSAADSDRLADMIHDGPGRPWPEENQKKTRKTA